MRNFIFFSMLVCIAVLSSCEDKKNTYTVTGTVPDSNWDGQMVYMSDYNDSQIVDSVTIVNGKFIFKGIADSAMARNLAIRNLSADIILEKGSIIVDMGEPYSAKGNLLTEKLNEYARKSSDLIGEAREKLSESDEPEDKILKDFTAKMDELSVEYLKDHSNDLLGAFVFINKMQNLTDPISGASFKEATKDFGENILNFGPIKQMAEVYEKLSKTDEGQMFTDFTVENGNLDNTPAKFSDYIGKGKYVLVDFWASWCGPCRREIPNLKAVYEKYKGNKFDILGVAVWDKREATLKAIEEEGIKWNQIIDAQTIPTEIYGIQGIPHIILFAPDGTIVARDLRGSAIGEKVAKMLAR